jgi:hypothetical protein
MHSLYIFVQSLTLVVRISTIVILKHRYEMSMLFGEKASMCVFFYNMHMEVFFMCFPSLFQFFQLLYKFTILLYFLFHTIYVYDSHSSFCIKQNLSSSFASIWFLPRLREILFILSSCLVNLITGHFPFLGTISSGYSSYTSRYWGRHTQLKRRADNVVGELSPFSCGVIRERPIY